MVRAASGMNRYRLVWRQLQSPHRDFPGNMTNGFIRVAPKGPRQPAHKTAVPRKCASMPQPRSPVNATRAHNNRIFWLSCCLPKTGPTSTPPSPAISQLALETWVSTRNSQGPPSTSDGEHDFLHSYTLPNKHGTEILFKGPPFAFYVKLTRKSDARSPR